MRGRLGLLRPPIARAGVVAAVLLLTATAAGCASHEPSVRVSKVGPLQTPFQLKMGQRVVGVRSVPTCSDASPDGYNSFHRAVRVGDTWIASGDDGRGNPGLSERAALWSWPGHGCWKRVRPVGLAAAGPAVHRGPRRPCAATVYAAGADLGDYEIDQLVPQLWTSINSGATWRMRVLPRPAATHAGALVEDLIDPRRPLARRHRHHRRRNHLTCNRLAFTRRKHLDHERRSGHPFQTSRRRRRRRCRPAPGGS